jgi:hypothetical protein
LTRNVEVDGKACIQIHRIEGMIAAFDMRAVSSPSG